MKQTKCQTIPLTTFVSNVEKAYKQDKFGLRQIINKAEGNKIQDSEMEEIINNFSKVQAKVNTQPLIKSPRKETTKSLTEKVKAQKEKLKQEAMNRNVSRKKMPNKNRMNYHTNYANKNIQPDYNFYQKKDNLKKYDIEAGQEQQIKEEKYNKKKASMQATQKRRPKFDIKEYISNLGKHK